MTRRTRLRDELRAGVGAGLAGGILTHLFAFAVAAAGGVPLAEAAARTYTFIASIAMGPAAATHPPSAVPVGVVLHLAVSIGWALGYVYLVRSQPQLLRRPWISGLGFGVVVYVFMAVVLIAAGLYRRPTVAAFETGLVAHLVFFGLPVALIVSRVLGAPASARA